MIKQYARVKFSNNNLSKNDKINYPFHKDGEYIFLGEIPNMPGYCIVANFNNGELFCGYPIKLFSEVKEEDVFLEIL